MPIRAVQVEPEYEYDYRDEGDYVPKYVVYDQGLDQDDVELTFATNMWAIAVERADGLERRTGKCFNVDFSILGFRSCVPLVADRSNTLNSVWQEPSRLRLTGVSDLAAMATLQEFLHCIYMGLVLFCLFAVFNLSLLYQYL